MTKRVITMISILGIAMLALGLRVYAANRLDVDADEPVYLSAALDYANFLRNGQYKMLAWGENTYEHPALYKIFYGVVLLTQRPIDKFHISDLPRRAPIATTEARDWNMAGRYLSVSLGTLTVLILALVNPFAGLFLGINSLSVKYTSEVYLEALPLLTSLLCALSYLQWYTRIRTNPIDMRKQIVWLALSSICLGMTAASKYVYSIVGVAIVVHFMVALFQKQFPRQMSVYLLAWAFASIAMFFLFDPYLWPHPFSRLVESLLFHIKFQDANIVKVYHYPSYQPLLWLSTFSTLNELRPASAFIFKIDQVIFIFAMLGLPRLFQKNRLFFYWLTVGLLFLLVWTTKWQQYTLIILVPFCLSASEGMLTLLDFLHKYSSHWMDSLLERQ